MKKQKRGKVKMAASPIESEKSKKMFSISRESRTHLANQSFTTKTVGQSGSSSRDPAEKVPTFHCGRARRLAGNQTELWNDEDRRLNVVNVLNVVFTWQPPPGFAEWCGAQ